jgi:HAD superfamily hydrolase (TIGR01509 family)
MVTQERFGRGRNVGTLLQRSAIMPEAIVFDLDGVLLDSEQLWNESKQELVRESGGRWREDAPTAMMGMSSPEWSRYIRDELGVGMDAEDINRDVVRRMEQRYRRHLPLLPGALEAVRSLHRRWPLALASSANREIIDFALGVAGLAGEFSATVSSEEVERGKPAPDVYLEAAHRLGVRADRCVAIEDSSNGLRSAAAAGMAVLAVPNEHYPPDEDALLLAAARVDTLLEVTPELVERLR